MEETQGNVGVATIKDENQQEATLKNLNHYVCEVGNELLAKSDALSDVLLQYRERCSVVFCSNRSDVEVVEKIMRRKGIDARRITSDLSDEQLEKLFEKINAGEIQVIIAADFLKNVLINEFVDVVVNYSLPSDKDDYSLGLNVVKSNADIITIIGIKEFSAFHSLKKTFSEIEFKDFEFSRVVDVVTKKLDIFLSALDKITTEIRQSDLEVAKQFLNKYSVIISNNDFLTAIAKFSTILNEQVNTDKLPALEEELGGAYVSRREREDLKNDEDYREHNSERGGRREFSRERDSYNRGRNNYERSSKFEHGHDRRDDRHSDDRYTRRGHVGNHRDRFDGGDNYGRSGNINQGNYRGGRRGSDRYDRYNNDNDSNSFHGREQRRGYRQYDRRISEDRDSNVEYNTRLYVGRGTDSGLTDMDFRQLISSIGDVAEENIVRIKIRDNYSFIDVKEHVSEMLINNLNGIEYNGEALPVEFASKVKGEK